jgi:transcriptional regulator with XRE-family HTH domain
MPQNAISRLESMSYGKPTITTLKRLASAFDVGLEVRFSPFSKMADWVSGTPHVDYGLSADSLSVVPFEEEEKNGTLDREYLIMVFDAKSNESIPQACDQANIVSTVPWRFSLAEQEKRSRTITDRVVQIDRGRTITEATITTPKRIGPTLAQSLNETLPVMKEGVS